MGDAVNRPEEVGDRPDVQDIPGLRPGEMRPKAASRAPSADSGSPSLMCMRSPAGRPPRSIAALIDPAEVPTMTAAVRGSQAVTSVRAPSTAP